MRLVGGSVASKLRGAKSLAVVNAPLWSLSSVEVVSSFGITNRSCSRQRDTILILDGISRDSPFIISIRKPDRNAVDCNV